MRYAWARGRFWTWFVNGLFFTAVGSVMALVVTESWSVTLGAAIAVFVCVGALMSWYVWHLWPGGDELAADDRVAVVRSVGLGRDDFDPRLASAVLDYAAVVRRAQEKVERLGWKRWVAPVSFGVLAVEHSFYGPVRIAVGLWIIAVGGILSTARSRRTREQIVDKALRAEAAATRPQPAARIV